MVALSGVTLWDEGRGKHDWFMVRNKDQMIPGGCKMQKMKDAAFLDDLRRQKIGVA